MIEFKIIGMKELDDLLKKLPEDFQIKAGWKSVIEGAKIVREKAIALVPVASKPHYFYPSRHYYKMVRGRLRRRKLHERRASGTGTSDRIEITPGLVRRSIQVRRMRQHNRGIMQYMVGPMRRGFMGGYANDPYYWKWLEYGKRGYPAQRFLRNAFDSSTKQSIETMRWGLAKYIDSANKKVAKIRMPA